MLQQRMNTQTADNDDVTQEKSHQQEDNDRLPDDENVISFPPQQVNGPSSGIKLTERVIHNIFGDTRGRYHRRRMEVLENSRKYKNTLLQTSSILDGFLDIVIPSTFDLLSARKLVSVILVNFPSFQIKRLKVLDFFLLV
jgi:hypothetical protein